MLCFFYKSKNGKLKKILQVTGGNIPGFEFALYLCGE